MIQSNTFDVVILGSGIAGLSAADELLDRGLSCVIIDSKNPGNGATSAPMLLANPATGRRAKRTWRAEEGFRQISDFLERVEASTGALCYENNGVLRPALTKEVAKDFERSPEKYKWQKEWITWFPEVEFSRLYPYFGKNYGGLQIEHSLSINGPEFIQAALTYLSKKGLKLIQRSDYTFTQISGQWIFTIKNRESVSSKRVIDASGKGQIDSNHWKFLPLHAVKGQTATFHFDEPLPLSHSVSSLGYMAYTSALPNQLTVGSTYEHTFEDLEPTPDGLQRLKSKLRDTLPDFANKIKVTEQWANVRVTVPDKMPVVGQHPEFPGLYIIGALGSKGMMMGRYAAYCLAESIFSRNKTDLEISVERFL